MATITPDGARRRGGGGRNEIKNPSGRPQEVRSLLLGQIRACRRHPVSSKRARLAVRRVRSAPQQALVAENPHDPGGDDQREEHAKPPEAIRAHHAPPPLRTATGRGQQALSHGESGAKSGSYLGEAGCRWPSRVSLGAQGERTRSRCAGPNNDTCLLIHLPLTVVPVLGEAR